MLLRAAVQDVKTGSVSRRLGQVVVVMQYYPRFLPKELVDEYVKGLAPEKGLFTEFKAAERASGDHDGAFAQVDYESRFELTPGGMHELERVSALSKLKHVYLICQCALNQRCHADLLLLLARHHFQAEIPAPRIRYPTFESRLDGRPLPVDTPPVA